MKEWDFEMSEIINTHGIHKNPGNGCQKNENYIPTGRGQCLSDSINIHPVDEAGQDPKTQDIKK